MAFPSTARSELRDTALWPPDRDGLLFPFSSISTQTTKTMHTSISFSVVAFLAIFACAQAIQVQLFGENAPRPVVAAPYHRFSGNVNPDTPIYGYLRTYLARSCTNSSGDIVLVAPQKGKSYVTRAKTHLLSKQKMCFRYLTPVFAVVWPRLRIQLLPEAQLLFWFLALLEVCLATTQSHAIASTNY